jgi:hypothetical protein
MPKSIGENGRQIYGPSAEVVQRKGPARASAAFLDQTAPVHRSQGGVSRPARSGATAVSLPWWHCLEPEAWWPEFGGLGSYPFGLLAEFRLGSYDSRQPPGI